VTGIKPMQLEVSSGPSKSVLAEALFAGITEELSRVTFEFGDAKLLRIHIVGIQREDESDENWIITGHAFFRSAYPGAGNQTRKARVTGRYSTKSLTGLLEIE